MIQTQKAVYELLVTNHVLEGRPYTAYGIVLTYAGVQVEVEDLSLRQSEVEELVERCNRLDLSPCHFQDVLDDFLAR